MLPRRSMMLKTERSTAIRLKALISPPPTVVLQIIPAYESTCAVHCVAMEIERGGQCN